MKPVVSSLVALAIAIAPLSAMAKPTHRTKAAHAKVVKHKVDKEHKAEKIDRSNKGDGAPMVRVKAGKKGGAIKAVVHHAHNVDLSGAGHKEPRVDRGVLVTASMKTPASHGRVHTKVSSTSNEMPRLPNPKAGKPSKGGSEKGAHKPAEKKSDAIDDNSGELTRDEDNAELVARIRGRHAQSSDEKDVPADSRPSGRSGSNDKAAKTASRTSPKARCTKDPVEIVRGPEVDRIELTKCDGTVAPLAVEHLSILIRPGGAARPTAPLAELAKKPGPDLAHGIRRVDPRLIDRIQTVVDHFSKPGAPAKLFVISGSRPASVGSMHASGRAIDFRVEGIKNEDVVTFCKTLRDTGCGFYPNSSFVHLDVRDKGAGHVTWIDASGPGETPRYVSMWPLPPVDDLHIHRASTSTRSPEELAEEGARLLRARRPNDHSGRLEDREDLPESADEHPAKADEDSSP